MTVSSPINVSTPVKQTNAQFAKGGVSALLLPFPDLLALVPSIGNAIALALSTALPLLPPLPPLPLGR